jgi:succinate dehydrogenase flavin-adding protein (antitoxin of CptAB toxin-antitoxin module)
MTQSAPFPLGGGRHLERLKWKSRRGLLELDLVFARFWKDSGGKMDEGEVAALERLLAMPDNDLLDVVMGRAEIPESHLRAMVEKLRAA